MKRLILYDLDGTLVDTLEDISGSANAMLAQLGLPAISRKQARCYIGRGGYQFVKDCLGTDDAKRIERGLKLYRAHYHQHMLDHTYLYPHAKEILTYFNTRTQAVVTNKPNPYSAEILKALGVADYFFRIIAGDSEYPKKPDPTSLRAMLSLSGVRAEEAVFIGDSQVDVQTGRSAGMMTVGIQHGFAEDGELIAAAPDLLVRDFQELLEIAVKQQW